MEQINETEKKRTRQAQNKDEATEPQFDWLGFGMTAGTWVLQGMAVAAGGAIMNRSIQAFSSGKDSAPDVSGENVVPMKRVGVV